jgi:hypothetical protein
MKLAIIGQIVKPPSDTPYLETLKNTQGSWSKDSSLATRNRRKKIELSASKKRKNF